MPGSNGHSQLSDVDKRNDKRIDERTPPVVSTQAHTDVEEQPSNYEDVRKILQKWRDENPLETEEQRKQREKREKWEGIISGIGDAVKAMSNLYFTTQYAPNMYDPHNSMSQATRERFDKAKAQRDRLLNTHLNYAMKIAQMKDADREWRRKLRKDQADEAQRQHDNAIADAKHARDKEYAKLRNDLERQKINAAEADARRKKIEADYAEAYQKARIKRERSAAGASNARAGYYNRGGSSAKNGEYPWYDRDGKVHYARTYDAAAYNARIHGTWNEEQNTSISERNDGFTKTTTSSTKPGKGYSRPNMIMPGVGGGKKMPGVQ